MKLSRTAAYAFQAVITLAEEEQGVPVPSSRLAEEGNMPERFLLQILRNLVAHGLLVSMRGVDGGYKLSRPATDISLLDVIEAIEGPLNTQLPLSDSLPGLVKSKLKNSISNVTENARNELKSIKIASLTSMPAAV